ncbi:MAG TPA: tripartite tricarboxylate transporter TctB family protein [Burkholderiales bacterium]|jgi:hypothetical protein
MRSDLLHNKDFLAGLLMLAIGGIGFYMALDYPFGTTQRMGPGYFPRVLALILMVFGVYVLFRGLKVAERVKGVWGWRALACITAALIVFGWTMDRLGFIPALVAMFFVSAYAGHEFRWKEVVILTALMVPFAIGVFIYALGLPYPLMVGFGGY